MGHKKTVYGLKDSNRAFYKKSIISFTSTEKVKFEVGTTEQCLFIGRDETGKDITYIVGYVDDLIVADRSNQGNSLTVRDGQGGGNGRWESTSIPIQWTDPQPLWSVPGTPQVEKNFFLDEVGSVRDFVSVVPVTLVWKDRVGGFEVKLTQGLPVSLQVQYSWTIPSGSWTHRRTHFKGEPEEMVQLFHSGRLRQETLEKAGHRSPTWTVLRSLQKVYGSKRIRG